jgi:hypothetical protein
LTIVVFGAVAATAVVGQSPAPSSQPAGMAARLPLAKNSGYVPRDVGPVIAVSEADHKGHDLMLRVLEATRKREDHSNVYYGSDGIADAQGMIAAAASPADKLGANVRLMVALLQHGDELDAKKQLENVRKIADEIGEETMGESAVAELAFCYALVNLRYGETQNCCLNRTKDSCLLPIKGTGVHTKQ